MNGDGGTAVPTKGWITPPEPVVVAPEMDMTAIALASAMESLIALGASVHPRNVQGELGPSDAGQRCDRRLAYKLARTPRTNFRDPLRSLVGVGVHGELATIFARLGHRTGRWLIEHPVEYRGIAGTCDLYDRYDGTVIDFKTTTLKKLAEVKRQGPPAHYLTQVQIYAAGLAEGGETPLRVALLYVPIDGALKDIWAYVRPVDTSVAFDAVDRVERLANVHPELAKPTPDRLCGWCDHYRPDSTDLRQGCPGRIEEKKTNDA